MSEAVIYTDGACTATPGQAVGERSCGTGTPRRSSWRRPGHDEQPNGADGRIQALESLTRPVGVHMYTDSKYVLDGITKWLPGWQRNGWKTASKQPVKNTDLWQRLVAAMATHRVQWTWVKGHSGDPGNERADESARLGIAEATRR